jgi:hypothetical protein
VVPTLTESDIGNSDSIDPNKLPIVVADSIPDLATQAGVEELRKCVKEIAAQMRKRFGLPLRAVIIDTLGAAFAIESWNDPSQVRRAISVLSQIKDDTGATVIGVHHHGKNVERGPTGSFVLTADPDFILSIFREAELSGVVKRRSLSVTKNRRGPTGWQCDFNLVPVTVCKDADGVEVNCPYVKPLIETVGIQRAKKGKGAGGGRAQTSFRAAMTDATITLGSDQNVHGDGPAVRAVQRSAVRAEFDRRYTTDTEDPKKRAEAMRKAFDRGLDSAVKAGWAMEGRWGGADWLWRIDNAS